MVELHGSAVEALVAAQLDVGDAVSAAAGPEARLREDPYRNRLWALLAQGCSRIGVA